MKITVDQFISGLNQIAKTNPIYKLGGKGLDGTCDCVGLIIGALERVGLKYKGIHGSNYIKRFGMDTFESIGTSNLEKGMLVYKGRFPEDSRYSLPDRYKKGEMNTEDWVDYYHVGVVLSVNPLKIMHCTSSSNSSGIFYDKKLGNWKWAGKSFYIDYEGKGGSVVVEKKYPTLRKGYKNDDVRTLQQMLVRLGYSVGSKGADGVFGNATYDAVRQVQAKHGLHIDGIAGKATWALLERLVNEPVKESGNDLSLNADGEDIGARANITVLDLERDKAIALREEYEAMGYRTEVSYG